MQTAKAFIYHLIARLESRGAVRPRIVGMSYCVVSPAELSVPAQILNIPIDIRDVRSAGDETSVRVRRVTLQAAEATETRAAFFAYAACSHAHPSLRTEASERKDRTPMKDAARSRCKRRTNSRLPKVAEPIRSQFGIDRRMLDVLVTKPCLNRPCVMCRIGKGKMFFGKRGYCVIVWIICKRIFLKDL